MAKSGPFGVARPRAGATAAALIQWLALLLALAIVAATSSRAEPYPGIDLIYRGNQVRLEYEFVVAAGADPRAIALRFDGARGVHIAADGALVLQTPLGPFRQPAPVVYQQYDEHDEREPVAARWVLGAGQRVGIEVGRYDRSRALVIATEFASRQRANGPRADHRSHRTTTFHSL